MKKLYTLAGALCIVIAAVLAIQRGNMLNRLSLAFALLGAIIVFVAEIVPETSNPYIMAAMAIVLAIGISIGVWQCFVYTLKHIEYKGQSFDIPESWVTNVDLKKIDNGIIIYQKCYCDEKLNETHQKLVELEWIKNADTQEKIRHNIVYSDENYIVIAKYNYESCHTDSKYTKEYDEMRIKSLDEIKAWFEN